MPDGTCMSNRSGSLNYLFIPPIGRILLLYAFADSWLIFAASVLVWCLFRWYKWHVDRARMTPKPPLPNRGLTNMFTTIRRPRTNDDFHATARRVKCNYLPPNSTPAPLRVRQPYDVLLVLDVEATCLPGTDFNWPNEIIVSLSAFSSRLHAP